MIPVLACSGLTKEFVAGLPVLNKVELTLGAGEVVALMGENGAGKSTLAAILAGIQQPTSGTIRFHDQVFTPHSRRAAQLAGVAMVTQELNLIPTLTVAENLTIEAMPNHFGVIDRSNQRRQAKDALALVGAGELDPSAIVARLGVAQRQLVEIAAGLRRKCRVLILDEPTAALSPSESEALFKQIELLRGQGVCIVYITHRLNEVFHLADRAIVLRDGGIVADISKSALNRNLLVRAMVGRDVSDRSSTSNKTELPALELKGVRGINLTVNQGEVVGLAGLVGAGRTELLRSVFGADKPTGEVLLRGRRLAPRNPSASVRAGLGFLTEDRKDQGLLLPLAVRENISVADLPRLAHAGIVNRRKEAEVAERSRIDLRIRSTSIEQPVSRLSGGNQQKVVLARWLAKRSEILLLDEPTRGIDIGARQEIYDLIEQMAKEGKAVLLASSDMNELMALCDRIVVLYAGIVTDELRREAFAQDRIMAAALGGAMIVGGGLS